MGSEHKSHLPWSYYHTHGCKYYMYLSTASCNHHLVGSILSENQLPLKYITIEKCIM